MRNKMVKQMNGAVSVRQRMYGRRRVYRVSETLQRSITIALLLSPLLSSTGRDGKKRGGKFGCHFQFLAPDRPTTATTQTEFARRFISIHQAGIAESGCAGQDGKCAIPSYWSADDCLLNRWNHLVLCADRLVEQPSELQIGNWAYSPDR